MLNMSDDDLFALCVWDEAQGEPFEGKVAVARVIYNRMANKYASDGTVEGTILHKWAFSGFWAEMQHGHYTQIAFNFEDAEAQANRLLIQAKATPQWAECQRAVLAGKPGVAFTGGPAWRKLDAEPHAVLYYNPQISSPKWATPEDTICDIYHHRFCRDG